MPEREPMRSAWWRWYLALVVSCGQLPPSLSLASDSGVEDQDAGRAFVDSGVESDGGNVLALDSGVADAGQGVEDAGSVDGGWSDAGPVDAGFPDAGFLDAGSGCPQPAGGLPAFRIRAMAANLTSGSSQSYDPGHGKRIMQGAGADVVMIQEFNYANNTDADIGGFVRETFGAAFSYVRGSGSIPNGVVSRWPITAHGEWVDPEVSNRTFAWAKLDLPGPNDLWAVSVHLLTSSPQDRNQEAKALLGRLAATIPQGDYVLVGGDFNTDTHTESCLSTLTPRLVAHGPHPADQQGNQGTNANRSKPYDRVLASACLQQLQRPTEMGGAQLSAGLVLDTRVFSPLSAVAPAQAGDSAASQMQHMAVIKDFVVQP